MSERQDYDRLADDLGDEADALQRHNDELEEKIADVRQDWERKRADPGVPGAAPPEEQSDPDASPEERSDPDASSEEQSDQHTPRDD